MGEKGAGENKGSTTWQEALEGKEKYAAKELFDLIQAVQLDALNPQETRRQLLEHGQKEEDIDSALKLMACISAVNRMAFGGEPVTLNFMSPEHAERPDIVARYDSGGKDSREGYEVRVEGLHNKTLDMLKSKIELVDKDGKVFEDRPLTTIESEYLGTAVHEVRHRFQHQKGFKMFSPKDISSVDEQLGRIISFMKDYFDIVREDLEKEGASKKIIASQANPREFDAMVVEVLAQNKMHEGVTLEEFSNLVGIQPPEAAHKKFVKKHKK